MNNCERSSLTGYASIDKPWLKYYSDDLINKKLPEMNVNDYVYQNNKKHLGRIALNYFGNKITYEDFFNKVDQTARAFLNIGIKKGDIVTVSLPMLPESIYIFYALAKIGAISNMIDPRTNESGTREYINEVNSKILVAVDNIYSNIKNVICDEQLEKVIIVNPTNSLPLGMRLVSKLKPNQTDYNNKKIISWNRFIKDGKQYTEDYATIYEKDLPISIVHTGGTTGFPKGVLLTNDNYNAMVEQFRYSGINFKREHTWLGMIPLFFAYGGGVGLHHPLSIGMEIKVIPMFNPEKMDELVLKYKANHMAIIPSYYESIIHSPKAKKADFSFLVMPAAGSDRMDPTFEKEINDFLEKHNCHNKVAKGYGMSEVTSAICGGVTPKSNKLGSVGIPFSHSVVAIFDPETNKELQYGSVGEVCMTGPNVMKGYYNNPEENAKIMRLHEDGKVWIHSGDLGYMDEDGVLYIEGRMKRMIIKYGGFKVFPTLIEKTIMTLPAVENVSVIGVEDIDHPEFTIPKANIVIKKEYKNMGLEDTILEQAKAICEEKLPDYCVPTYWKVKDNLPLTNAGKIDFRTLEVESNEEMRMERETSVMTRKLKLSK